MRLACLRRAVVVVSVIGLSVGCLSAQEGHHEHDSGEHADHDHDATATHSFDDVERWTKVFDDPARDAWQKPAEVVRYLGLGEGDVVADIGAGTGYFIAHLSEAVGETGTMLAVDVETALIEHMTARAAEAGATNVRTILADFDDPKLPEAGVDCVLIVDTWHHINARVDYLGKLARALRPEGRVVVIDFHEGELPVGPPPGHKLSREHVVAEFEEAGWTLDREGDLLPYQYLLVFAPGAPSDK